MISTSTNMSGRRRERELICLSNLDGRYYREYSVETGYGTIEVDGDGNGRF